jgi:sRNA-binding regulator protein Hfq
MESTAAEQTVPVPETGGKAENEPQRHSRPPPNFLQPLLGKKVLARMVDGRPINATLAGYNPYEIVFDIGNGRRLLCFKHAISSIEFDGPKQEQSNAKK